MSINVEKIGHSVAILHDSQNKKNDRAIFVAEKKEDVFGQPISELKTSNNKQTFEMIPNILKERNIVYVAGASGSGKSYFSKNYIEKYRELHPTNEVFLFSALDSDATLDKLKYIKRVKLNDNFLQMGLSYQDFENSLVILDDCDTIMQKELKNKVKQVMNSILQCGRHSNTSAIITSHTICNGAETKLILNEAHSITIFPTGLGNGTMKYLLDKYLGLDKVQIQKIKKLDTRAVSICKTYPMCVVSEHDIFLLNNK